MNDSNLGVFLCLGFLVFFFFFVVAISTSANRKKELRAFADHWHGQFHEGGFLAPTQVDLDFDGVTANISFTSNDDESLTNLTVPLRLPCGRLKLRPQNFGDQIGKFLGMEDIEVGVPSFDDAFIIQGSNPREIQKLLTEPVRAAIQSLRKLRVGFPTSVHLDIGSGVMRISVGQDLGNEKELSRFASRCRTLFDLLNPNSSQGIEFVDQPSVRLTQPTEEPDCLICGSPLKDGVVHCLQCKTPHHRDCWHYFGSCAVYGCGQKRFVEFGRS